jgi:peptidyl-prolyl cis-trans isomerase D
MALINKIREKSGWAIGVIAIALILFIVGGDLLSGSSTLFGGNPQKIGEISGEDISYQQFAQELEELKYNYSMNTGQQPSEEVMPMLRQQAWERIVSRIAYRDQYEKLGITVTEEELYDMVQGANIHPLVRQSFSNPETGEFNREMVSGYLAMLRSDTLSPQAKAQWLNFERELAIIRQREKYENLLRLTTYATKQEAEREYQSQSAQANVKFLYVPFFSIPDTAVNVTDAQLQDYLNRNRSRYKAEESRTLRYVTFSTVPSAQDSAYFLQEIKDLAKGLAAAENDSMFARANTDRPEYVGEYLRIGEIPEQLRGEIATFIEGGMYGPYREGDTYSIYKLSDIKEDTAASVRASHILFRTDGQNKDEVRRRAQDVLQQIKAGASFEEMARQHGSDGTAQTGGDLGWFSEGRMVKPFENAVFNFRGTGLLPNLVETEFGYHIIQVTQPKTNRLYRLVAINKVIAPGEETIEAAFQRANEFAGTTRSSNEFAERVKTDPSLADFTAERIRPNDNNVNTITNAREMIRWAFSNDTKMGAVSPVFEMENQFVVATLTGKTEADEVTVDNFRQELTSAVRNELKAEQIKQQLAGKSGTLEEIAQAYGAQAQVNTAENVTLNSNSLQNVGFDPVAVGRVFGLKEGERTQPFKGENGVLMIEMTSKTEAPEIADFSQYRNQVVQTVSSRTPYSVAEAIKENADIEDLRHRFY